MKKNTVSPNQLSRLHEAIALHNRGRLDEADAIYADFLRRTPGHPDALHLRALISHARGHFSDALQLAQAALAGAPNIANFHNTAGESARRMEDFSQARRHFAAAVRLDPGFAMAHHNMSLVLDAEGLTGDALAASQQAVALNPSYVEALAHCLDLSRRLNDLPVAQDALARLKACDGDLARDAVARFHALSARSLVDALRFPEALAEAEQAIAASPGFWGGWALLGETCNERGDHRRAELCRTISANLAPDNEDARLNLAHFLKEQKRLDEAETHYRAWLVRQPDNTAARFGLAGTLLMRGNYSEGWPLYEARWELPNPGMTKFFRAPQWTGETVASLLLYAEQGLGDTLQMLRFIPEAVRRAGNAVTLLVPPPLARIALCSVGAEHVDIVTTLVADAAFDAASGLMSLPGIVGLTTPAEAALTVPYLKHDPERTAHFTTRLAGHPGRKLGIIWQGGQAGSANRRRRIPESALLPLLTLPGWTPVSLQFGVAKPAISGLPLVDIADEIADFADLAAAMKAVDAVVSLDSGPAHLAGALGIPLWILVPWLHDWRWGIDGERCDWYPSARLVRQAVGESWDSPIAGLVERFANRPDVAPGGAPYADGEPVILRNEFPLVKARCRDGIFTVPIFDRHISLPLLMYGECSPREAAMVVSFLRPGDTVIDVGANLGSLTLAMARATGETGRVLAFEPRSAIHACLQQSLADSGITNVTLHRQAVGAKTGRVAIHCPDLGQPPASSRAELADPGKDAGESVAAPEDVEQTCLDDLALPACRLLRIATDDGGLDALRGASDLVRRCRPVILVQSGFPDRLAHLRTLLDGYGYRVFRHESALFDATNFRSCPHNAFPGIVLGNLLALPQDVDAPPDARPA